MQTEPEALRFERLKTLQINVGNLCNQACMHCHVNASPNGTQLMGREVMDKVLGFAFRHPELTVDITGGAPEMNPDFAYLVEQLIDEVEKIIVRTNLTVFFEPGLEAMPRWFADRKITLVSSLPCYQQENVDTQRGQGVYEKSIRALQMLNEQGYGVKDGLELDLVYNPSGHILPGRQKDIEAAYKQRLQSQYGIRFNNLFSIVNAPIGRFRVYLEQVGKLDEYLRELKGAYNHQAVCNIMCRNLISVDWQGVLYNCDFNQAMGIPIKDKAGQICRIDQLETLLAEGISILTDHHCYCCTAGAGSSCTGVLVKDSKS